MKMHPVLNRKLHAVAAELAAGDTTRSHEVVKLYARELGVEHVSDLTDAQAKELILRMRRARVRSAHNVLNALNVPEDEEMSERQRMYLLDLKDRLGWSTKYLNQLIQARWGEQIYPSQRTLERLPRWVAIRLIALMKQRLQSKRQHAQLGGKHEVQHRHSADAQGTAAVQTDLSARPAAGDGR